MRKSGQYSGDNRWGIPDGNNRRESRWNPKWECQRNERRAFTRRPKCAWDPLKIDLISKWRLCSRCGPTFRYWKWRLGISPRRKQPHPPSPQSKVLKLEVMPLFYIISIASVFYILPAQGRVFNRSQSLVFNETDQTVVTSMFKNFVRKFNKAYLNNPEEYIWRLSVFKVSLITFTLMDSKVYQSSYLLSKYNRSY